MKNLNSLIKYNSIKNNIVSNESTIEVWADLDVYSGLLELQFQVKNFNKLNPQFEQDLCTNFVPRQNELWKGTCFEFFLQTVGRESYYEFNFSLNPAWNCYYFESYRNPNTPKESYDFQVQNFYWVAEAHKMVVLLKPMVQLTEFKVGLSAIIVNASNNQAINDEKQYFALKHLNENPDFHNSASFSLLRSI